MNIPLAQFTLYKTKWSLRIVRAGLDDCWPWIGRLHKDGYGVAEFKNIAVLAHRLTYFFFTGIDPGELEVCHTCDNPPCNNPRHLFKATHLENIQDCLAKGRMNKLTGILHPNTRISDETVHEIRRLRSTGLTQEKVARLTGVLRGYVNQVCNGHGRKNLV